MSETNATLDKLGLLPKAKATAVVTAEWFRQNVFHASKYWEEDSAQGIARAKRRGFNGIDLDLGMTKDNVFIVNHSGKVFQHGAYDPTGKYKRGDPIDISHMTWAEVQTHVRWPGGIRVITAAHAARLGAKLGVYTDFEAKGDPRFQEKASWDRLMHHIQTTAPGWRGSVMSLPKLTYSPLWSVQNQATHHSIFTLKAAKEAGFVTGLIHRGKPDERYFTISGIDYVKGGPFYDLYRKYVVRRLSGRHARFYV